MQQKVQVNLVSGNGHLYPMADTDLEALRRSGIGFTRFPLESSQWLRDYYKGAFAFTVHTVESCFQQIVERMMDRLAEETVFRSVAWKHVIESKSPEAAVPPDLGGEVAFIAYYGESDDDLLASMARSGSVSDDGEDTKIQVEAAERRADEFAHTFKHYLARYQIAVTTQKRIRADLGGIAYRFTFQYDENIANDTFYGEPGARVTEAYLGFSGHSRFLLKVEAPHNGTNNAGMGPVLVTAVQTLHGDDWVSNPSTVRSYPLRMLDKGTIPGFIAFLASHLS